jgi:hypothetical protein
MSERLLRAARPSIVLLATFVVHSLQASAMAANPTDTLRALILNPQSSTAFNLVVFFTIFLGIAVRPLKDRLGNAGTAVAVGFALLFSTSLALAGRFQLLDLEPIAGLGLFSLLGAIVGAAFRQLYETSWATTAAVSFVAGYGTMRLAAPTLLPVADEFFIIPGLLYVLAIVWLIYTFSIHAFPTGNPAASLLAKAWNSMATRPAEARQQLSEPVDMRATLTDAAKPEAALAKVAATQRTGKSEADLRAVIASRQQALAELRRRLETEFARYQMLTRHIAKLDIPELADLKRDFENLPEDAQAKARLQLGSLNEKLMTARVLANLAQAVDDNSTACRDTILRAKAELAADRVQPCLRALEETKVAENEAVLLSAQMQRFTNQLKSAAARIVAQAVTRAGELVAAR